MMNNPQLVKQLRAAAELGMSQTEAADYLCVSTSRVFHMKTKHNIDFGGTHARQHPRSQSYNEPTTATERDNDKAIRDARKAEFTAKLRRAESAAGFVGYKVPTHQSALDKFLLKAESKRDREEIQLGYNMYQFEIRQREAGLRPALPIRGQPQWFKDEQSDRAKRHKLAETGQRRKAVLSHIAGKEYTATQIASLLGESVAKSNDLLGRMTADGILDRERKIIENGVSKKDKRTWRWVYFENEVRV